DDALVLSQLEQVVIAGNDGVRPDPDGTGQHGIIIGIVSDHRVDVGRWHYLSQRSIAPHQVLRLDPRQLQPLGKPGAVENVFEFREQCGTGEQGGEPTVSRLEHWPGRPLPEQTGDDDVRISYYPHDRLAFPGGQPGSRLPLPPPSAAANRPLPGGRP